MSATKGRQSFPSPVCGGQTYLDRKHRANAEQTYQVAVAVPGLHRSVPLGSPEGQQTHALIMLLDICLELAHEPSIGIGVLCFA